MAEQVDIGRTWVTIITMLALTFDAAVILYLILIGNPQNSLHTSALAWAFGTGAAVLAGLGFGAIAPLITGTFKK